MKKSKELDNILNECLERLLVKGETIEQCLQSFPKYADNLKPLLETAMATQKAAAIQPRPEFKERARYQFYSALQGMGLKKARLGFSWRWQPRWVTVIAIILAFLLTGGSTVAVANGSMPDGPLYPVKLASEQVQLVLTPSALGKAELYAKLAERRVTEIIGMTDKNKPEHIERTTRRLDHYLTKIAALASTREVMTDIAGTPTLRAAPPLSRPAKGGRESPAWVERRAGLKMTLGRHAVNHPARLRNLLKTAPPSAKAALLRAIAVSESGYMKTLKSLD